MNRLLLEYIFEEYFLKNFSDLGVPVPYSTESLKQFSPTFINFAKKLFVLGVTPLIY